MKVLEIDDLERQVREALRQVHEEGESIEVRRDGEAIARLVPVKRVRGRMSQDAQALLDELDELAEEIGKYWPEGVSAVDAIRDVRE